MQKHSSKFCCFEVIKQWAKTLSHPIVRVCYWWVFHSACAILGCSSISNSDRYETAHLGPPVIQRMKVATRRQEGALALTKMIAMSKVPKMISWYCLHCKIILWIYGMMWLKHIGSPRNYPPILNRINFVFQKTGFAPKFWVRNTSPSRDV